MAVDSPLNDPNSTGSMVLNIIDKVITSFYVIVSVAKIISYGFIMNGSESDLRISWNIMDFIIVVFSVSISFFYIIPLRDSHASSKILIAYLDHLQQPQHRSYQGHPYAACPPPPALGEHFAAVAARARFIWYIYSIQAFLVRNSRPAIFLWHNLQQMQGQTRSYQKWNLLA